MFKLRLFGVAAVLSICAVINGGCATPSASLLSDRGTVQIEDPTAFTPMEKLPFLEATDNQVRALLHAGSVTLSNSEFTRLAFVFMNRGATPVTLRPQVTVSDRQGFAVEPVSYPAVQQLASTLLQRPVPAMPPTQAQTYYGHGTITSPTGQTYGYTSTTQAAGGFSSGFQSGAALGLAMRASMDRQQGETLAAWLDQSFLRSEYIVPPGRSVAGGLLYRIDQKRRPLKVSVTTGSSSHAFPDIGTAP